MNAENASVGADGAVVSTLMSGLVYVVALPERVEHDVLVAVAGLVGDGVGLRRCRVGAAGDQRVAAEGAAGAVRSACAVARSSWLPVAATPLGSVPLASTRLSVVEVE